jgi:hypothetical protein
MNCPNRTSVSNWLETEVDYTGHYLFWKRTSRFFVGFIHIIDKLLTIPVSSDATITNAHLSGLAQAIGELPPDPKLAAMLVHNDWTLYVPHPPAINSLCAYDNKRLIAYNT